MRFKNLFIRISNSKLLSWIKVNLYLRYQSLKWILLQFVKRKPLPRISSSDLKVDTVAMDIIKVLFRISNSEIEVNTVAMDIN